MKGRFSLLEIRRGPIFSPSPLQPHPTTLWLLYFCLFSLLASIPTRAQGQVILSNRGAGCCHDVPVVFAWDTLQGPGAGYTAQLFFGPPGTSADSLQPLFPTTTFRTGGPILERYVERVLVEIPGFLPGEFVDLQFRAFNGTDWENSTIRGASSVFQQFLGGGDFPPASLSAMEGQNPILLQVIPEPTPLQLALLAAAFFAAILAIGKPKPHRPPINTRSCTR